MPGILAYNKKHSRKIFYRRNTEKYSKGMEEIFFPIYSLAVTHTGETGSTVTEYVKSVYLKMSFANGIS